MLAPRPAYPKGLNAIGRRSGSADQFGKYICHLSRANATTRRGTLLRRVSAARYTAGERPVHAPRSGCCQQDKVPTSYHHLFLTGLPGVGNTTLIRRALEALAGKRLGGFYTAWLRERL